MRIIDRNDADQPVESGGDYTLRADLNTVRARSDFSGDGDRVTRIDPLTILDFVLEGDWEV